MGKPEKIEGTTLVHLDRLSRERELSQLESIRLERAFRREPKGQKPWTRDEVSRMRRMLKRGKKPAQIAIILSRTERAIWRKIYKEHLAVGKLCPADVYTSSRYRKSSIA